MKSTSVVKSAARSTTRAQVYCQWCFAYHVSLDLEVILAVWNMCHVSVSTMRCSSTLINRSPHFPQVTNILHKEARWAELTCGKDSSCFPLLTSHQHIQTMFIWKLMNFECTNYFMYKNSLDLQKQILIELIFHCRMRSLYHFNRW